MADLASLKQAMTDLQQTYGAQYFMFIAPVDRTTPWDELGVWNSMCFGLTLPDALLEGRTDLDLYLMTREDQQKLARFEPFTIHRWSSGTFKQGDGP